MPAEKFKLPASSYEELTKIVKGYGHLERPVNLEEVSKLIGIGTTVISGNVGFLLELNILEPGAKKAITSEGRSLAHSLEHDMPDEMRNSWRKIVYENEFISKLVTAIKIRNGMDEDTLQSHIAYSAGQPRKTKVMTGARTVIDILRAAELIKETDGKFMISEERGTTYEKESIEEEKYETGISAIGKPVKQLASKMELTSGTQVIVNVNLNVDCSPEELETVGNKLKLLIKNIYESDEDVDTESKEQ